MKKIVLVMLTISVLFINSLSFATDNESIFVLEENKTVAHSMEEEHKSDENVAKADEIKEKEVEEITPATQKILDNTSKKDKKIAEYEDKYNDKTYAYTAYVLDLIQTYSIPVCIIGIAIGAFNFYIIGEKKLDKREKGFSFIMAFLCGLVVFQVLPLIFALLVAGK